MAKERAPRRLLTWVPPLRAGIDDPYEEPQNPEIVVDAKDTAGNLQVPQGAG